MTELALVKSIDFACPKCQRPLPTTDNALRCNKCERTYRIINGIPDFISGNLPDSLPSVRSMAKKMDFLAPLYEHLLWQKSLLRLTGSEAQAADHIANFHVESLKGITGAVLDVACGTATYTRRIASPDRMVCGIDISMGMLRQGRAYIVRDNVSGVSLARARVEELPFEADVFDGVVCSGSLHLFPDVSLALREIARVMKPGALLTAQTFLAGNTLLNRWVRRLREVHAFELPELHRYVAEAGFEKFQPELNGVIVTFKTRKATSHSRP